MRAILHFTTTLALCFAVIRSAAAATAEQDFAVAASHYAAGRWQLAADEFDSFRQRHPQHPQAADAEFFQAESLVQLNQLDAARERYERFLVHHDRHAMAPRALFRWGECHYRLGESANALRLLRQFVRQQPDHDLNAYALPYLGQLLASSTNEVTAEADQVFHQAIERYPQGPLADECHLQLAILYYREQRLEEALSHLDQLLDDYPSSNRRTHAIYWQGAALLARGDCETAAEAFGQVIQDRSAEELHPAAAFYRGECLRRLHQWNKAEEQLRVVAESSAPSDWVAKSMLGLIRTAAEQDKLEQARSWVSRLDEDFPQSTCRHQAHQICAELLVRRQQYGEAIAELEYDTEFVPNDSTARSMNRNDSFTVAYLRAVAYVGNHQPAEALCTLLTLPREDLPLSLHTQFALVESLAWADLEAYSQAISTLREALTGAPASAHTDRCRLKLLRCLIADERYPEAAELLDDWPDSPESAQLRVVAVSELAEAAFARMDFEQAARWFHQMADHPVNEAGQARAISGLAWCHWELGHRDAAVEQFARLVEQFPHDPRVGEARLMLASLLEQDGKNERALAAYRQAAEDPTDPERNAAARLRLARLLERQGDYAAALHELNGLLAQETPFADRDQAHYLRGWVFRQCGEPAASTADFQTVHDEYPTSVGWADATYRLAERAYQAAQWQTANELLEELLAAERAAATSRFAPFALYLQGRIALAQNDWSRAAVQMRQVLTEHPTAEPANDARLWLAEAAYRLADYLEAADRFRVATEVPDGLVEPWKTIVPLRQAQILAAQHQWPEALAAAQAILDNPNDTRRRFEAEFVAGRALLALARLDDARAAFQRVVDDPDGSASETAAMAQYMIGETHRHQKRYSDAIRAYLKLDLLYDHSRWRATALLEAGGCYESLEETDEACRLYRQLLAQFPDSEQSSMAEQRLRKLRSESNRLTATGPTNRL